jgi:hypothetical protein
MTHARGRPAGSPFALLGDEEPPFTTVGRLRALFCEKESRGC